MTFPTPKEQAIQDLEFICKSVFYEFGKIVTDGMMLNYEIRKAIGNCYEVGVSRTEVEKIINKFRNLIKKT